jgi:UDPglucose 6-dehydrogenase
LVVEKSTVPAITAKWVKRTLLRYARESGEETCDFDVASNPEFLREGRALQDLIRPDRVVCGVESERARRIMEEFYRPLGTPIMLTGTTTAEIIKHAANSFLSMKISFINMVADLCEAVGADVEHVAEGLGMDPRIGPQFLSAGIGFGGYCFPKDLRAFIYLAEEHGVNFALLKEVEEINRQRVEIFLRKLRRVLWVLNHKTIGVLGLAFKPGTDDTRESPSLRIVQALREEGVLLRLHDPQAMRLLQTALRPKEGSFTYCETAYEAAVGAHALLILTEWPEYRELDWNCMRGAMALPLIVDGRNLLDPARIRAAGFEYVGIGRSAEGDED